MPVPRPARGGRRRRAWSRCRAAPRPHRAAARPRSPRRRWRAARTTPVPVGRAPAPAGGQPGVQHLARRRRPRASPRSARQPRWPSARPTGAPPSRAPSAGARNRPSSSAAPSSTPDGRVEAVEQRHQFGEPAASNQCSASAPAGSAWRLASHRLAGLRRGRQLAEPRTWYMPAEVQHELAPPSTRDSSAPAARARRPAGAAARKAAPFGAQHRPIQKSLLPCSLLIAILPAVDRAPVECPASFQPRVKDVPERTLRPLDTRHHPAPRRPGRRAASRRAAPSEIVAALRKADDDRSGRAGAGARRRQQRGGGRRRLPGHRRAGALAGRRGSWRRRLTVSRSGRPRLGRFGRRDRRRAAGRAGVPVRASRARPVPRRSRTSARTARRCAETIAGGASCTTGGRAEVRTLPRRRTAASATGTSVSSAPRPLVVLAGRLRAAPSAAVRGRSATRSWPATLGVELGARARCARYARPSWGCAAARGWCSTRRTPTPGRPARSSPTRCSRRAEFELARAARARASATRAAGSGPDGRVKTSAAWLIERAGFAKGYPARAPAWRISTKHTLALTNRGDGDDRAAGAGPADPRRASRDRFGVDAAPEPVLINCGCSRPPRRPAPRSEPEPLRTRRGHFAAGATGGGRSSTGQPSAGQAVSTACAPALPRPERGVAARPVATRRRARPAARAPAPRARCGGSAPWAAVRRTSPGWSSSDSRGRERQRPRPPGSTTTQVAIRPSSSHVPSTSTPGAGRAVIVRQAAATSSSSYCRSTLNARTTTGRRPASSKPPRRKSRPGGSRGRSRGRHPYGIDLQTDHRDVRSHRARQRGRAARPR